MISSRSIASSAVLRKDYGNSFLLLEPFFGKIIFELRIPAAMNDPLEHATGVEKWELLEKGKVEDHIEGKCQNQRSRSLS